MSHHNITFDTFIFLIVYEIGRDAFITEFTELAGKTLTLRIETMFSFAP